MLCQNVIIFGGHFVILEQATPCASAQIVSPKLYTLVIRPSTQIFDMISCKRVVLHAGRAFLNAYVISLDTQVTPLLLLLLLSTCLLAPYSKQLADPPGRSRGQGVIMESKRPCP